MDPATLALVIAGALAAFGIKRGARRPPPAPAPQEPEVEPTFPGQFPPLALYGGGRGLPPAVTEGGTMRARVAEEDSGDARDRGAGEEPAAVAPPSFSASDRAAQAVASGPAADVVGGGGGTTRTRTTLYQWAYVPAGGRWPGGRYLYQAGQPMAAGATPIGGPVPG